MSGFVEKRGTSQRTGKTRWRARYRGGDGRERSHTFDRRSDAERWLAERLSEVATGAWVPPERARVPFGDYAERWLESHPGKPKTIASYRSILDCHVLPKFGTRPVASIERPAIRKFVADLAADGKAPNTVRSVLNVIKAVFTYTVEAGGLRSSPAARVSAPRGKRPELRIATEAEVAALADAIDAPYATLVYFAAYTGLRAGEIAALRIRDLDLMVGRVHVRSSVAEVHGELVYGTTKSGKDRTVSLPPFLRDMLTAQVAAYATDPDAWVFQSGDGAALRQSFWYRRYFRPAADSVGLEGLRFHDLRHTCAAFLIASGAHPRALMERLGHHSITITLDTYGHLLPSLDDALTGALEDRFQATDPDGPRPTRGLLAEVRRLK